MIYTAVFQNSKGEYSFESHVATHDRTEAWHQIHKRREDEDTCLVLLIDGQANAVSYTHLTLPTKA